MAGIVSTLESNDDVSLLAEPVDDLVLPLVAPLGADDDHAFATRNAPDIRVRPGICVVPGIGTAPGEASGPEPDPPS